MQSRGPGAVHCSLTVDQKHVSIRFISLCFLSVPLASNIIFGIEHSYDKYLWKEGKEGGEKEGEEGKRDKCFPSLGVSAEISFTYSRPQGHWTTSNNIMYLLSTFCRHCVERYGETETQRKRIA